MELYVALSSMSVKRFQEFRSPNVTVTPVGGAAAAQGDVGEDDRTERISMFRLSLVLYQGRGKARMPKRGLRVSGV